MQEKRSDRVKIFNKIIRLIVKNSEKGLEKFYNEYGKLIYSVAKGYCKTEDRVNSVVNSVLVKIWKKAKDLNDVYNPEGFMYTVTKNCAKDEMNEPWNLELNEQICSSEDSFIDIEEKDSFDYLVGKLKEHEQEILILRFRVGYTFQDISDIKEKPLATITTT